MKSAALILPLILVMCTPVPAIELVNGKPVLTQLELSRMHQCEEQSGCFIVTLDGLKAMVLKAMETALHEAQKDAAFCRRKSI